MGLVVAQFLDVVLELVVESERLFEHVLEGSKLGLAVALGVLHEFAFWS